MSGILSKFSEKLEDLGKTVSLLQSSSNSSNTCNCGMANKYESLRQCFVCVICKSIVTFPAVISRCCGIVLGCESCVAVWYNSNNTCPHCRNQSSSDSLNSRYIIVPALHPLQDSLSKQ